MPSLPPSSWHASKRATKLRKRSRAAPFVFVVHDVTLSSISSSVEHGGFLLLRTCARLQKQHQGSGLRRALSGGLSGPLWSAPVGSEPGAAPPQRQDRFSKMGHSSRFQPAFACPDAPDPINTFLTTTVRRDGAEPKPPVCYYVGNLLLQALLNGPRMPSCLARIALFFPCSPRHMRRVRPPGREGPHMFCGLSRGE